MVNKWLDLVAYNPRDHQFTTRVRVILDSTDVVTFSGDETIIQNMRDQGVESSLQNRTFFPKDGIDFLKAIADTYDNPMLLQATGIRDGDPPYELSAA